MPGLPADPADSRTASQCGSETGSNTWSRIKPILAEALSLHGPDRSRYLDEACAGDAELRREAEIYLGYESDSTVLNTDAAGRFSAVDAALRGADASGRIGPYRVIRELGRGGMGVVYLAERADGEFAQQVALKLIYAGVHSEGFIPLFRRERQILAQLQHPSIARLIDGGTTSAGQPYYAMEVVDGIPVTRYAVEHKLPLDARLDLFSRICDAVAYAHRNLVIHRDLKPDNILVDASGSPKLIDFGLAKIFAEGASGDGTSLALFTPAYASPEQIKLEPLTTATDIYSLGVLLYELLCGHRPFGKARKSPIDTIMAVCETEPQPPSSIEPSVPRELDNVALMAMRKQPERRYASVDSLREDVERYRGGLPVRACPDTLGYRARKFLRRHRLGVTASAVAVAASIAAVAAIVWQARQTELRFNQLRQFAHTVVFDLHDAIETLPGSTPARKLLVASALRYLDSLAVTHSKDAALQIELAEAYRRIGAAQGNPNSANLGDTPGALASLTKAREIASGIVKGSPHNVRALHILADIDSDLSGVSSHVDKRRALHYSEEAAALLNRAAQYSPTRAAHRRSALALYQVASNQVALEDYENAITAWKTALSAFQQIAAAEPLNHNAQRNLALVRKHLAAVLGQTNQYAAALENYREAERIDSGLVATEPLNQQARLDLSFDESDLGWVLARLGRFPEAAASHGRALALRRELAAADPANVHALSEVAASLSRIAGVYDRMGETDRAVQSMAESISIWQSLVERDPKDGRFAMEAACANVNAAEMLITHQRWNEAMRRLNRASAISARIPPEIPRTREERDTLASIPARIAECRGHVRG